MKSKDTLQRFLGLKVRVETTENKIIVAYLIALSPTATNVKIVKKLIFVKDVNSEKLQKIELKNDNLKNIKLERHWKEIK